MAKLIINEGDGPRTVELRGSVLDVRSRLGEGRTFAFGLPIWKPA